MVKTHTDYLWGLGSPKVINGFVEECVQTLKECNLIGKIDTILYTGLSGAFIGIPLALRLNLYQCALRKEKAHSEFALEGMTGQDILIVDDIIETGKTLNDLYEAAMETKPRSVRVLIYYSNYDDYKANKFDKAPVYFLRAMNYQSPDDFVDTILGDAL